MWNSLECAPQSATAVERIKTWTEQVFFISIASIPARPSDCRCCQWRRAVRTTQCVFRSFDIQPIFVCAATSAAAAEAKVIGNSVHFNFFFLSLFSFDPCPESRRLFHLFANSILDTILFSHDDFPLGNFGESNSMRILCKSKYKH